MGNTLRAVQFHQDIAPAQPRGNAARTNKTFDTSILNQTIDKLCSVMTSERFSKDGWIVIDSSELTIDQTVEQIPQQAGLSQLI